MSVAKLSNMLTEWWKSRSFQIVDNVFYVTLLILGIYFIYQGDVWYRYSSRKTLFAESDEPLTEFPNIILRQNGGGTDLGEDFNITFTAKTAAFSTERNLTFGENSFVNTDLKVYFEQIDEKMGHGKVFMMTPSNFVPGMDFYLNPVYKNSTSLRVTTLQLTTEEGFWDGKTGLATNSIFFLFPFHEKNIDLPGGQISDPSFGKH